MHHFAIIQTKPGIFDLLKLNETGDEIGNRGRITSGKKGAEYGAVKKDGETTVGVAGYGTHRECRRKLLAFWNLKPSEVGGHEFNRKKRTRIQP